MPYCECGARIVSGRECLACLSLALGAYGATVYNRPMGPVILTHTYSAEGCEACKVNLARTRRTPCHASER